MTEVPPGDESKRDRQEEHEEADLELSMAGSKALVPLLLMFALTVLWILLVIARAEPVAPHEGAIANRAYGPVDFPSVFASDEALVGLEGGRARDAQLVFPVPAAPFSEGIFPCSDCHADLEPDPEPRELTMHDDIVFEHDAEHRWCLDCHDEKDRDQLRLANGSHVPFTESYRLCGQCHGTQYRDWRSGIHGKRTGYWDGAKRYLLCVHCHNPHRPRFAPLEPLPPPVRPQFLRSPAGEATATREGNGGQAQEEAGGRTS